MRVLDIDITEEEEAVKGFYEELYLQAISVVLTRGTIEGYLPRNMPPAAAKTLHSPAHMFSVSSISYVPCRLQYQSHTSQNLATDPIHPV